MLENVPYPENEMEHVDEKPQQRNHDKGLLIFGTNSSFFMMHLFKEIFSDSNVLTFSDSLPS